MSQALLRERTCARVVALVTRRPGHGEKDVGDAHGVPHGLIQGEALLKQGIAPRMLAVAVGQHPRQGEELDPGKVRCGDCTVVGESLLEPPPSLT